MGDELNNSGKLEEELQSGEVKGVGPLPETPGAKQAQKQEQESILTSLYRIKMVHSSETEYCQVPSTLLLKRNDLIIIDSRYGKDLGRVLGPVKDLVDVNLDEARMYIRLASAGDLEKYEKNKHKERDALDICREKVLFHKLEMKLVSAHYLVEESKILFFFTADARVDFRELVKDLVSVFKMRIELRQIGVRDESRVLGGMGVCGRFYCCHGLTDRLRPVSIKMAKEQNLSLNSMKISGPCGRLLCCLSYEYDFYHATKAKLPPEGGRLEINGDTFRVEEINVFKKKITLIGSEGKSRELPFDRFSYSSGQGKWFVNQEES